MPKPGLMKGLAVCSIISGSELRTRENPSVFNVRLQFAVQENVAVEEEEEVVA